MKLLLALSVLFASTHCGFAQNTDSVVIISTVDYQADSVSEEYINEVHYREGLEIINLTIHLDGNHRRRDSTRIETVYTPNGKRLRQQKYEVSFQACEPKTIPAPTLWYYYTPVIADSSPAPEIASCNSYYTSSTTYSDTIEVTFGMYYDSDDTIYYADTIRYNNHKLPVTEVHYQGKRLNLSIQYAYEYDTENRAIVICTVRNDQGSITSHFSRKAYHEGQVYDIYDRWIYGNDSLHFRAFERMYDSHYNQIEYKKYENGVYAGCGFTPYTPDNHMKELTTFDADSQVIDHHEYKWKSSKHRMEYWSRQHYKDMSTYNGTGYTRIDTAHQKETTTIWISGARDTPRIIRFKRPHSYECKTSEIIVLDNRGRNLYVENIDYQSRRKTSVTTWWYSK